MNHAPIYDEERDDASVAGAHAPATAGNLVDTASPRTRVLQELQTKQVKKRQLPTLSAESPHYGSTMVMLRKTHQQVEEYGAEFSSFHTVLSLPGSTELKRTVAKMFADQKGAEAISAAEWKRREAEYKEHKARLAERQNDQLKKEKDLLQRELQTLKE
eukprot:PhM_4_TR11430/c0_g2_i1/m.48092